MKLHFHSLPSIEAVANTLEHRIFDILPQVHHLFAAYFTVDTEGAAPPAPGLVTYYAIFESNR
jgi:hypothetical protein